MLAHTLTPTLGANERQSPRGQPEQPIGMGTRQERVRVKRKVEQEVLDSGLGQKRTTLTRCREGADMSAFISFLLLQLSLSEQDSSAGRGRW